MFYVLIIHLELNKHFLANASYHQHNRNTHTHTQTIIIKYKNTTFNYVKKQKHTQRAHFDNILINIGEAPSFCFKFTNNNKT